MPLINNKSLYDKIIESVKYIKTRVSIQPEIGIILGTGLAHLETVLTEKTEISYEMIPHFAVSTVESHAGKLLFGKLQGRPVVMMQGRLHFYEGYDLTQVTYPVRVMKELGIKTIIVSNAAGGLHPDFCAGDLMMIKDHINLTGQNPLIGPNDYRLGQRFPDMCEPYDLELIKLFEETAVDIKLKLQKGVYAALTGPCLETPAEYKFLKIIGADAVGMSTVPEVIVAKHCGLKVIGISIITDLANTDKIEPMDSNKIIKTAKAASPKMTRLICEVFKKLKN